MSKKLLTNFINKYVGDKREVLWEDNQHDGYMSGYTDNYIKVTTPYDADAVGNIETITLKPYSPKQLLAQRQMKNQLA